MPFIIIWQVMRVSFAFKRAVHILHIAFSNSYHASRLGTFLIRIVNTVAELRILPFPGSHCPHVLRLKLLVSRDPPIDSSIHIVVIMPSPHFTLVLTSTLVGLQHT